MCIELALMQPGDAGTETATLTSQQSRQKESDGTHRNTPHRWTASSTPPEALALAGTLGAFPDWVRAGYRTIEMRRMRSSKSSNQSAMKLEYAH